MYIVIQLVIIQWINISYIVECEIRDRIFEATAWWLIRRNKETGLCEKAHRWYPLEYQLSIENPTHQTYQLGCDSKMFLKRIFLAIWNNERERERERERVVKRLRKSNVLMLFYGTRDLPCIYSNNSVEFLESTSDSYHRMNS